MFSEEQINDAVARSMQDYEAGYNCAETVLLAVCRAAGRDDPCIPRVATGFGGGMGRQGEACGALTGAVMAIGLLFGRDQADDQAARLSAYTKTEVFIDQFRERNGRVNCRDLTGVDMRTEEGRAEYHARSVRETTCTPLIAGAVRSLLELLNTWEAMERMPD
jgi:C_GCAxxG_C_C family probable redox protein